MPTTAPFQFTCAPSPSTAGRRGCMHLAHGRVDTPAFAPVGTQATVKSVSPEEARDTGAQMILANTYHLMLRPGADTVEALGGLHRFMNWPGPILTDSGGFQVYSLSHLRRLDHEGVTFRSHLDGAEIRLTPERCVRLQDQLGADIIMALDDCAPATAGRPVVEAALERTHAWARACRAAWDPGRNQLFAIVQGGLHEDLRARSARTLADLDFPGYAIGGLSVGESKADMARILELVTPLLPADKPRYLMGVGAPEDILEAVDRGVDFFDCVLPTRIARNGALLVRGGRLNLRNAAHARDESPVEPDCGCYACRNYSRAYLRHLIMAEEMFGHRLATIHNLAFMQRLMGEIRQALEAGTFSRYKSDFLAGYTAVDEQVRHANRAARARSLGRELPG